MASPFLLAAWLALSGSQGTPLESKPTAPIFPLTEVRKGQIGVGRTVFTGGRLEEFSVEVLGVMQNSTPRHSTILARLSGGPLADTGVIAGMSGSPVWIDGRLVGAVSSTYLFSKAPIAGITPIEEMLAIPSREWREPGEAPAYLAAPGAGLARVRAIERGELPSPIDAARPLFAGRGAAGSGVETRLPVVLSGFGAGAESPAAVLFRSLGFEPVLSGTSGTSGTAGADRSTAAGDDIPGSAELLQPGSPVAVELLRGDFRISAVGTVTARDGDRVLAFGHPLFGAGTVSFPIATADVVAVIPSVMNSFKVASVGATVGALEQDRATGILGRIGGRAQMVPVRLGLKRGSTPLVDYQFEVATHRLLTPVLLDLALDSAFAAAEKEVGASTVDVSGRIEVEGHAAVQIEQFLSGDQAAASASKLVAAIAAVLLDNEFDRARISGITLALGYREDNLVAALDRVWTDRTRVHPGERIEVKAVLRRARGTEEVVRLAVDVPDNAAPGPIELAVGDAAGMARFESRTQRAAPRSLDQLIELLNRLRRSSEVYALLTRPDAGVAVRGEKLSGLPPSAYALLAGGDGADSLAPLKRVTLDESSARTPFQVGGLKTIKLTVEAARE